MNRTLVLTGDSGVGKTSFIQILMDPIFNSHPIIMNDDFQSPQVHFGSTRILLSPDDAEPEDFYSFTLIPNGEYLLKVKFK